MTATYAVGDVVVLSGAFAVNGVATDPTTITLYVKAPGAGNSGLQTTTYTYAGAQVVRDSTGNYHYNFTTAVSGEHYYRYEATGAVIAANESTFYAISNFK